MSHPPRGESYRGSVSRIIQQLTSTDCSKGSRGVVREAKPRRVSAANSLIVRGVELRWLCITGSVAEEREGALGEDAKCLVRVEPLVVRSAVTGLS